MDIDWSLNSNIKYRSGFEGKGLYWGTNLGVINIYKVLEPMRQDDISQ